MKRLSRNLLRKLILAELKIAVDEDALMPVPTLGEPHYLDLDGPACPVCGLHHDIPDDSEDDLGCARHSDMKHKHSKHHQKSDLDMPLIVHLSEACGCGGDPEELIGTMGSYDYDEDYMSSGEAFSAGVSVGHQSHKNLSYMARPQLYKIAKYAAELLSMIGENETLDDWQESKIAQMSQMIGSVYHSIDHEKNY